MTDRSLAEMSRTAGPRATRPAEDRSSITLRRTILYSDAFNRRRLRVRSRGGDASKSERGREPDAAFRGVGEARRRVKGAAQTPRP